MIVSEKIIDGIVVIAVRGKLMGASETDECHAAVKDYIMRGNNKIIVNLEQVEWVNSCAMGMLISCYTSCRNAHGDLKIAAPTEKTKNLFRMTKLDTVFNLYQDSDKALQSFQT